MSGHFHRALLFLMLLSAIATGIGASAQVYDATADFSPTNNPNGTWSYGWSSTLGSTYNLDTVRSGGGWTGPIVTNFGSFPYVQNNQDGVNLLMHPGPNGEYSVLRWTAPNSGMWRVDAIFSAYFQGPTTDVHVLNNGTALFNGNITPSSTSPFSQTIAVATGNTIDFAVGYGSDGGYSSDATLISAKIKQTSVPEPSSIPFLGAMTLVSGGLFFGARRRSRRSKA